jgi:hypothetical protein
MPVLVALGQLGCTQAATPANSSAGSGDKADSASDLTFTCTSASGETVTALLPQSRDQVTITREKASKPLLLFANDNLEIATDLAFSDRVAGASGGVSSVIVYHLLLSNGDSKGMNAQLLMTTIDNTITPATLQTEVLGCSAAGGDASPVDCGAMSCKAHQACVQDLPGNGGKLPDKRCADLPSGCSQANLCNCLMSQPGNAVCGSAGSGPDACQDDSNGHVVCELI